MMYGIYKIKQILDCSDFDFSMKSCVRDNVSYLPLNYILDDYVDMFNSLADIKEIIDRMVQDNDENKNIDKLQEGEHNEL